MNSKSIEFFYKHAIESSQDEESDGETKLLPAAACMAHAHFLLPKRGGGSSVKYKANKDRDRVGGHVGLMQDYFHHTDPIYYTKSFRRRYRMSRKLFMDILHGVKTYDDYFSAKLDCTGKIGFSSYQKCSAAIRQLAYGVPGDLG
jgi:hypothetical protein